MEYTDLLAFGVLQNDGIANRTTLFKDYLSTGWGIQTSGKRMPNSIKALIGYWEKYVNEVNPAEYTYKRLVDMVIQYLGADVHFDMMNCTRFYHTTSYLHKKGVPDGAFYEFQTDLWEIKNTTFWTY